MRVGIDVHVLNGPSQGTASVWMNLLPHLPSTHEYWLYSFDPGVTQRLFPGPHFVHKRIGVHQPFVRVPLLYPWLARRDRCDVFHVNYYGPLLGASGLVVTIQDLIYLDFPEFAPTSRRLQMRFLGRLSAWAARQVTTASAYSRNRLVALFGIPEKRVTVVPNGLGPEWTTVDAEVVATAWRLMAPRVPRRFLLAVGRLDRRKNFPLAARVTRALQRLGLVEGLVVVGPHDFGGDEIRRAWRTDGTASLVTHLEGLSVVELQALYAHSQGLLFLSLAEGFGMPLLEAMAMGTPVVASNRTAVPEICGDGAVIVDPDDESSVVEAARRVVDDPTLREDLVARGRVRVGGYTAAQAAQQMLDVYSRACGS